MSISLYKASLSDTHELYDLQIKTFKSLLDKYQNYDFNPGAEKIEKTINKLKEYNSDYYFICLNNIKIGAVRISHFDTLCKLKQIYILPEYQGYGYSQKAIALAEALYPNTVSWGLYTIKQEEKLCYLYQKIGYVKIDKEQIIKDGMSLIFFKK